MKRTLSAASLATFLCLSSQAAAQPPPAPTASAAPAPTAPAALLPTEIKVKVSVVEMPDPPPGPVLSLDALKGGKLFANGFSLGGAYSLHIPAKWLATTHKAQDLNSSFMPYVAIYPGMMLAQEETRAYCSTSWALASPKSAQDAADKHAFQRSQEEVDKDAAAMEAEAAKPEAIDDTKKKAVIFRKAANDFKNLEFKTFKKWSKPESEAITEYVAYNTGWTIGDAGVCWLRNIGVYAGKPLGISPTIRPMDGLTDGTPAASSIGSLGVALSPNAGISLLAGLTYWNFSTEQPPSENRDFWTWTISIGGNTDIVGQLLQVK
jgi:hypothetical protein